MLATGSYNNKVFICVLAAEALAIILEYVCFYVSHWMFAFQYYKIARQTPFSLEMDYVPERIIKADNTLNKIMICLNINFPVLYGLANAICNYFEI